MATLLLFTCLLTVLPGSSPPQPGGPIPPATRPSLPPNGPPARPPAQPSSLPGSTPPGVPPSMPPSLPPGQTASPFGQPPVQVAPPGQTTAPFGQPPSQTALPDQPARPPPPMGTSPPAPNSTAPPAPPVGTCSNPCLLPDGSSYGECNNGICEPLCQDTPGYDCGSFSGTHACRSNAVIQNKCCKTCHTSNSSSTCTDGPGSCTINGKPGECRMGTCVEIITECGGVPCTSSSCEEATCGSDGKCGVVPRINGAPCGVGSVCQDGQCTEGTGGVGAVCTDSTACQLSLGVCNVNLCVNQRCSLSNIADGTQCGGNGDGACLQGTCVGSTDGCVGEPDGTHCPLPMGQCEGGYCREPLCVEGTRCGPNHTKVCRVGRCVDPTPCTAEDNCQACNSRLSLDKTEWLPLVLPCWVEPSYKTCKAGTGVCRKDPPTAPLPPADRGEGGVFGRPPPMGNVGVKWKVDNAVMSSTLMNASLCIDGFTATLCKSRATDQPTWIQFDLGRSLQVGMLRIHNVGNWCGQKLVCGYECGNRTCTSNPGFLLRVGDSPCDEGEGCQSNPVCSLYSKDTGEDNFVNVMCKTTAVVEDGREGAVMDTEANETTVGRYVQVVLVEASHYRQVEMTEVEVFAPRDMDYNKAMSMYPDCVAELQGPPVYQPHSFRPPSQSTTNTNSILVGICILVSMAIVGGVGLVLRLRRVEQWWLRTFMFGTGVLRVFDWVSDILFFLYVSAIPDLGEVNNYSIATLFAILLNATVEFARLGWGLYGVFKNEPFLWSGSLVVLFLQIPASILADINNLSVVNYHSRMRDRWDWVTHLIEDVPQISIACVYIVMRDFEVTSMLTLGVSVMALVGSAFSKLRRKHIRHQYHAQRQTAIKRMTASRSSHPWPHPQSLPELEFAPPKGRAGYPTESLAARNPLPPRSPLPSRKQQQSGDTSHTQAPDKGDNEVCNGEYDVTDHPITYA